MTTAKYAHAVDITKKKLALLIPVKVSSAPFPDRGVAH
jgi:hypothetical protein